MKLWMKILIAMVLGAFTGYILGPQAEILKPIGKIFLSLINMVIVLLVLSSMAVGITSIHDPKKLSRIGMTTLALYLGTTLIAIMLGIFFGNLFQPGAGLNLESTTQMAMATSPSLSEILLGIIPSNPISSLANGHVMQIIVFALFLGLAINFAGEKGKPLLKILESLAEVMYRLTSMVMEFSPVAVFAIIASTTGTFGIAILLPLLKFLGLYYSACALHVVVIFGGILVCLAKVSPWPFFRGMRDAIVVAFSTCSSAATLPISMNCATKNLGVSKNICNFVLPLGSTINMNGTAIYQGMSVIFISQAYGIHLDWQALLTIVVTATLSAIGAAGIPGTGFMMLSVVFVSVGLPIEGLALLAGIDRIRDMVSTVLNILGDAVVAVYIGKKEGEFDESQYNALTSKENIEQDLVN